uniref:Uncharacterized protein n=1 Tax=viral metagenome TaxID=1070528 RepID=A0A6C0F9F7_9ZZZZ
MASRSPSPSYYGAYRPQISEVCPGDYEEMLEERKNRPTSELPAFEGDLSHLMDSVSSLNYDKLGNPTLSGGLKSKKRAEEASKKLETAASDLLLDLPTLSGGLKSKKRAEEASKKLKTAASDLLLDLQLHSSSHEDGMKIPHKLFIELKDFLTKLVSV